MSRRRGRIYDSDIKRSIKKANTDNEVVSFGMFPFEVWREIALYLGINEFVKTLFQCNSLFYNMDWRLPPSLGWDEIHAREKRELVRSMCRLEENEVGTTYILISQNWDTVGYGPDHNSICLDNVANNLWYAMRIVKMMEFYTGGWESQSWQSQGCYSVWDGKQTGPNTTYYAGRITHEDFHALAMMRKSATYIDIKSNKDVVLHGYTKFIDFFYADTRNFDDW
jgi:hypothetical protein